MRRLAVLLTTVLTVLALGGATATAATPRATELFPRIAKATSVFPSNALTVRDPAQRTGRRVALPLPDWSSFDPRAVVLTAAAAVLMLGLCRGFVTTMVLMALAALGLHAL